MRETKQSGGFGQNVCEEIRRVQLNNLIFRSLKEVFGIEVGIAKN
jgi:hypothetical protein